MRSYLSALRVNCENDGKLKSGYEMISTVKIWFEDKGYGFIRNGSVGSRDVMVHASQLINCTYLKAGRTVEFDVDINDKGLVAKNVMLVHENTNASFNSNTSNARNISTPFSKAVNRQHFASGERRSRY